MPNMNAGKGLVRPASIDRTGIGLAIAQGNCKRGQNGLALVRERLCQVLEQAYGQQSFAPLQVLFWDEEAALSV